MADLGVTPEYLEELAKVLHDAAGRADRAKRTTVHIPTHVETTWGPLFRGTNDAFIDAEHNHHEAVQHIQDICTDLAARLLASADAYTSSDTLSGDNLNKQLLAC